VHLPVLLHFGITVLSAFFALNPTLALFGTHVRMLGLTTIADGVVTYFAIVHLVRQRREWIALLVSMLTASLVMLTYELIQLAGKDPLTWVGVDAALRPIATLGQATTLGVYLTVLGTGCLALAVLIRRLPGLVRAGLVVQACVLLVGAVLTGTRAAALGFVAAVVIFVVLTWAKHPNRRARLLSVISGVAAAIVLGGVLLATPLGARLTSILDTSSAGASEDVAIGQLEPSSAVRLAIYDIAAQMVAARPLTGFGPDNFAAALPQFRPERAPQPIRQSIATSPHSWIAAIATSSGLLGLAAFLWIICAAAFTLSRREYSSVAIVAAVAVGAYLASGAVSISAIETDTLFWLGIGGIVSATGGDPVEGSEAKTRAVRGRRRSASSPMVAWVPWAVVVAVLALSVATFPSALEASRLAATAATVRTPTTAAASIEMAKQSTRLDPNRAEYWQQLALSYVAASRWTEAAIAFQSAARLAPYDIRFLTDGIQVELVLANAGDTKALERAGQLADQAVRLDPNNPNAHLNRAVVSFQRRNLAGAVDSVDRALFLDPNSLNTQLYPVAAQIYVAATHSDAVAGRLDDAIARARHGVALLVATASSLPLRLELASVLVQAGRSREAVDVLDAALAIAPTDQSLLQLKAEILRTGALR
jgi:O-antigen ligase/tetratricopeptide (TPR) repeat protein